MLQLPFLLLTLQRWNKEKLLATVLLKTQEIHPGNSPTKSTHHSTPTVETEQQAKVSNLICLYLLKSHCFCCCDYYILNASYSKVFSEQKFPVHPFTSMHVAYSIDPKHLFQKYDFCYIPIWLNTYVSDISCWSFRFILFQVVH